MELGQIPKLSELFAHSLKNPTASGKEMILPISELINNDFLLLVIKGITLAGELVWGVFPPLRFFLLPIASGGTIGHFSLHLVTFLTIAVMDIGTNVLISRSLLILEQNIT
jgi:hypothetical protein